jgi:hypothetical protein
VNVSPNAATPPLYAMIAESDHCPHSGTPRRLRVAPWFFKQEPVREATRGSPPWMAAV